MAKADFNSVWQSVSQASRLVVAACCLMLTLYGDGIGQIVSIPSGSKGPQAQTRDELDAFGEIYDAADSTASIALARNFVRKYPQSNFAEYAYMAAMRSYDEMGDWDGAHEMAGAILRLNPENIAALSTLARLLIDSHHQTTQTLGLARRHAEAGLVNLKSLSIPSSADSKQWLGTKKQFLAQGNFVLGWVAFQEQKPTEAIAHLKKAIAFDPQGEYFYRLSLVHAAQGELQTALTLARKALQIGPAKVGNLARLKIEAWEKQVQNRL